MEWFQATLYTDAMIGKRIRLARNAKNLTLREVGEAMRVTAQAVAGWERSNPNFRDDKFEILANILEVNLDWLKGKIGNDDEIIRSEIQSESVGQVPVIAMQDALAFAIFSNNTKEEINIFGYLQPTVKIIGQGFAVLVEKEDEIGYLKDGDYALFDNGRQPKTGDIVLSFLVVDGVYYQHFVLVADAETMDISGNRKKKRALGLVAAENSEASKRLEVATRHLPIAVLVELRRIAPPWTDGLQIIK